MAAVFISLVSIHLFMLGELTRDEATSPPGATEKRVGGWVKCVALGCS